MIYYFFIYEATSENSEINETGEQVGPGTIKYTLSDFWKDLDMH